MKILRRQIQLFFSTLKNLEQNEDFSISTKYKILKIRKTLEMELECNLKLLNELVKKYGTISEEGEIFIKKEFIDNVSKQINDFNNEEIELPNLYFTIDELSVAKINWKDLEILLPLIKD